jgi:hypothetical protein
MGKSLREVKGPAKMTQLADGGAKIQTAVV